MLTSDPKGWTELYGLPSISRRISIARPPFPPFEDSDVLVLSSRSTLRHSSAVGNVLLYLDLRLSLATSNVNWAFAGLRYTIPLLESDSSAIARYRWEHIIDSHGSGEPPDEGTVVKRIKEDGSEEEVEIGVGRDPDTGNIGLYEEIWEDEPLPAGSAFAFLISDPSPNTSRRFLAVVGEHAMALSQHRNVSDAKPADVSPFEVTRIKRVHESKWETVYSTGDHSLEQQLRWAADEVMSCARIGWKRGDRVGGELGGWTVWDAR